MSLGGKHEVKSSPRNVSPIAQVCITQGVFVGVLGCFLLPDFIKKNLGLMQQGLDSVILNMGIGQIFIHAAGSHTFPVS